MSSSTINSNLEVIGGMLNATTPFLTGTKTFNEYLNTYLANKRFIVFSFNTTASDNPFSAPGFCVAMREHSFTSSIYLLGILSTKTVEVKLFALT